MSVNYSNGAIIKNGLLYERDYYDVSNNLLTAQFDGRGCISRYSVVNKWNLISDYHLMFEFGERLLDIRVPKTVTMVGRTQIVEFETVDASVRITQFADSKTNALFQEFEFTAKRDLTCKTVFNVEINFKDYIQEFFVSRFSLAHVGKLIFGSAVQQLKGRKKRFRISDDCLTVKNDCWGECYYDVALSGKAETLEENGSYINQYKTEIDLKEGETKSVKIVQSFGTRGDFSETDVGRCLTHFDEFKQAAEDYIASFPKPEGLETEEEKAFFNSTYNTALSMYKERGKFKGLLAGVVYQSPARTYFRDGYWTALAILDSKPELVRNELVTLAQGIGKNGECPSAVKYNFRNYWGKHYDSPAFFAILLFDYVRSTGDKSVLDVKLKGGTVLEKAILALDKLAENTDETGLLYKGGKYNRRDWCDNVFREGYVTYDEALFARANYALSYLLRDRIDVLAEEYYTKYEKIKIAINDLLWDTEKGYFVNYKNENFTEDNLSIDTVPVLLFGLTDDERAKSVLKNMEEKLETVHNPDAGGDWGVMSVFPFYKHPENSVGKSSYPFYYHNGGDWPYLSAAYAYAKLIYGMDWKYPLFRWFEYNAERGNFTPVEFYSPFHPRGSLLQGWSGFGAFVEVNKERNFFK